MPRALSGILAAIIVTLGSKHAQAVESLALNRYEPTPLANDWLRVQRPTGFSHSPSAAS